MPPIHPSPVNKQLADRENYPDSPVFAFTDLFTGVVFLLLIVISTLSLTYRSEIIQQQTETTETHSLFEQLQELETKLHKGELNKQQIILYLQKIKLQLKVLQQDKQDVQENLTEMKNKLTLAELKHQQQQLAFEQEISQLQQQQRKLKQQLNKVKKTKLVPQALLAELKTYFQHNKIPATIDYENGTIHFADSLLFATSSSTLTTQGERILKQLAEIFNQVLPCYSFQIQNQKTLCKNQGKKQIEAIFIEGHTDDVPFASKTYDNWQLSMSRARETYKQLIAVSPQLNRLKNRSSQPLFSLSAYGDSRPISSNETKEGRARNRRIDIRLISFGFTLDKL